MAGIHDSEADNATSKIQLFAFYNLLRKGYDMLRGRNLESGFVAVSLRRGYDALSDLVKKRLADQLLTGKWILSEINENTDFSLYARLP